MADALLVEIAIVDDPLRLELAARDGPWRRQLDSRAHAQARLQAFAHGLFEARQVLDRGCVLRADQQLVHRPGARDDDAELAAEAWDRPQGVLDRARIDVLSAHDEHVVDAPVEPARQARVGAAAGTWLVGPRGFVAGDEPDHRLRGAVEVRVDRRA